MLLKLSATLAIAWKWDTTEMYPEGSQVKSTLAYLQHECLFCSLTLGHACFHLSASLYALNQADGTPCTASKQASTDQLRDKSTSPST